MIDEIMTFSSATLKKLQRLHIEASVTTRNFVMSASKLTARIKNRESSTNRLFGVTVNDPNQPHRLILAHITN